MSTTLLDFELIFDYLSEDDQYFVCRLLQGADEKELANELKVQIKDIDLMVTRVYQRIKEIIISERRKIEDLQ